MSSPPPGVEVDHIEFPAGRIQYYRAGTSGPPIVLLHGGGLDNGLVSWRHSIPALSVDHRVYVPDLPGQGGSTGWRGRGDQRTLEEVLRWLFDSWNLTEATVVGVSLGGSVATGFALRHPRRVRGLVLVDSSGMQHRLDNHLLNYALVRLPLAGPILSRVIRVHRGIVRRMLTGTMFAGETSVTDLESLTDEIVAESRRRGTAFTDWQRESINRKSMNVNHLPHLEHIRCPTMLIHGENDRIVPVAAAHKAASAIPDSSLRVIGGAGHWPHRQKPTEFNNLLSEFTTEHAS